MTYPSPTARPPRPALVLEGPASTRNVLEPIHVLKIWCLQEPMKTLIPGLCQVKGQTWLEDEESRNKKKGSRKKKLGIKQIWDAAVSRDRKMACYCNKEREIACMKIKKRTLYPFLMQSNSETADQTKDIKNSTTNKPSSSLFHLIFQLRNSIKRKAKPRWNNILSWFPLLLLSLCFQPGLSQVCICF